MGQVTCLLTPGISGELQLISAIYKSSALQTQHIKMLYTLEYKYTGSEGRQWAGWMELLLEFSSLSILWKVYSLQSEVVHIRQSMIQVQIAFHARKHHLRLGNVCFLRGVPRHLQVLSECRKKCYWICLSKGCSKNLKTRVLLAGLPSALTVACTNHFEQETLSKRWKEIELD